MRSEHGRRRTRRAGGRPLVFSSAALFTVFLPQWAVRTIGAGVWDFLYALVVFLGGEFFAGLVAIQRSSSSHLGLPRRKDYLWCHGVVRGVPETLKAELAGKLGVVAFLEDALVANVFGVVDYLSNVALVTSIVSAGRPSLPDEWDSARAAARSFSLSFWPVMSDDKQPDLLITLQEGSGKTCAAILFECKFRSGLSGPSASLSEKPEGDAESSAQNQLTQYGDRFLRNEFRDRNLRDQTSGAGLKLLFYLTADYSYHQDKGYLESASSLHKKGLHVLWLSWRDFPRLMRTFLKEHPQSHPGMQKMTDDLLWLLENRKKLIRFHELVTGLPALPPLRGPDFLRAFARERRSPAFARLRLAHEPDLRRIPLTHLGGNRS